MSKKMMAMPRFFATTAVVVLLGFQGGISYAAESAAPPAMPPVTAPPRGALPARQIPRQSCVPRQSPRVLHLHDAI
jgi:hypothetical protein